MKRLTCLALLALVPFWHLDLKAENWPHWRGPAFNGSSTEKSLPSSWSTTNQVAWKTALPGWSGSTPIVWGDNIFLTTPDSSKNLLLLCLNARDGSVRWQKTVAEGADKEKGRGNMASPSPVTDGKSVFVIFGNGDLAAFDFDGKELWKRNPGQDYGKFSIMWIYGSSPLLYKDKLYLQVLQRTPVPPDYPNVNDGKTERDSYLLCLDPATGKDLWRQVRPTDAKMESMEAYSSPIPFENAGRSEIIVLGGDYLTGHDAATGKELWRAGGFNNKKDPWWRIVPSAVTGEGMIFGSGPKRDPVLAFKGGGSGDVTTSHLAWSFKEFPTDCPTPLFYQGKLFVLDGDKQMMTCLDPKTGEKVWQGSLGVREIFRASPTGADNKIYCISERGTVVVLEAGKAFKVLSTIPMGDEPVRASVVAANGKLLIRTGKLLYSIGR